MLDNRESALALALSALQAPVARSSGGTGRTDSLSVDDENSTRWAGLLSLAANNRFCCSLVFKCRLR